MIKHYVGARYVPKFASPMEWAADTSYEALTIVTFNNDSYTSKIQVPPTVGNPANNPKYWALTGNYNAQVEQYRQETENLKIITENYNAQVEQYRQETENVKINYSKCFNTAANMIADTSLTEGMIVKTLGYNKIADNGGAFYKIYNTKEQNSEHYENLSNGKYALLIPNGYITPEMFGAIGDGVTDDTDAIQNAINYANEHDISILAQGNNYLVSKDITLYKKVGFCGNYSPRTKITSNNAITIRITGGGDNIFTGYLGNIEFTNVLLIFGDTKADYGNQYVVEKCTFRASTHDNLITLKNNCWNMVFDTVVCRSFNNAFFLNFDGVVNSGAAIRFDNCTASDGGYGFRMDGATADGADVFLSNCNLEHVGYSFYITNGDNGNVITAKNIHCELNGSGFAYNDGSTLFLDGGWALLGSNTDYLFNSLNTGRTFVSNMRLASAFGKYFKGEVHYDNLLTSGTSIYHYSGTYNPDKVTPFNVVQQDFKISDNKKFVSDGLGYLEVNSQLNIFGGGTAGDITFTISGSGAPRSITIPRSSLTSSIYNNGGFIYLMAKEFSTFTIFEVTIENTTTKTIINHPSIGAARELSYSITSGEAKVSQTIIYKFGTNIE